MSKKSIALSIIFLTFILFTITIFLDFLRYSDSDFNNTIGIVDIKKGKIKVKIAGTGSWTQLQNGDLIQSDSIVISDHGSSAKYLLKNGTVINHQESSMLIIKMDDTNDDIEKRDVLINIVDGTFVFLSEGLSSRSKIKMKNSMIELDKKGKSSIKINKQEDRMKVYVVSGKLNIATEDNSIEVNAGEFITSSPDENNNHKIKKEKIPDSLQKQLQDEAIKSKTDISNYQFIKERTIKYIYQRLLKLLSF